MWRWSLGLASVATGVVAVFLLGSAPSRDTAEAGVARTPDGAPADLGKHPDWAEWNTRGKRSAGSGRADVALGQFQRAIELNPDAAVLYANRGGAKLQLGDRQGAIADCSFAIRKDPGCTEAWINRAQCLAEAGDWAGAARDYEMAIDLLKPGDWVREHVRVRLHAAQRRAEGKVY